MIIELAILIMLESSGNPNAHNKKSDARGLCQITQPVLEEFNHYVGSGYGAKDLFNPQINRRIARWYLGKRIPEMLKVFDMPITLDNVLICWNAGIQYCVTARITGKGWLPEETKQFIKRYKEVRDGYKTRG